MYKSTGIGVCLFAALSLLVVGCATEQCLDGFETGWQAGFDLGCTCADTDDAIDPRNTDESGVIDWGNGKGQFWQCLQDGYTIGKEDGWEVCCDAN